MHVLFFNMNYILWAFAELCPLVYIVYSLSINPTPLKNFSTSNAWKIPTASPILLFFIHDLRTRRYGLDRYFSLLWYCFLRILFLGFVFCWRFYWWSLSFGFFLIFLYLHSIYIFLFSVWLILVSFCVLCCNKASCFFLGLMRAAPLIWSFLRGSLSVVYPPLSSALAASATTPSTSSTTWTTSSGLVLFCLPNYQLTVIL